MKKFIFLALFTLITSFSFAQVKDRFRVNLDLGYTIPTNGGGGILFTIEPKWNLTDNMNVGIRWQSAAMSKGLTIDASGTTTNSSISANSSFLGTYDYYFNSGSSSFAPYVGAGLGLYVLGNMSIENSANNDASISAGSKFGGVIHGGFEAGKFRMGVEYNLIPKSDSYLTNGTMGKVSNSYIGITLGFFIGGGRWGGSAQ